MKRVVLILAGGIGERFWPLSKAAMPKQFLSLSSDGCSLFQHTVNRILPTFGKDCVFVSTVKEYRETVMRQAPDIAPENILCEPARKNTAAAVAYASFCIKQRFREAVVVVLPSDHVIMQNRTFIYTIEDACEAAGCSESIVTLGVEPTRPETGYGYIRITDNRIKFNGCSAFKADGFTEKPTAERAAEFLHAGNYMWNSGIFIWKLSVIMRALEKYLPFVYESCISSFSHFGEECFDSVCAAQFDRFEAVSVDRGILEKTDNILVIPGSFIWDDAGSWAALDRINTGDFQGNKLTGDVLIKDIGNCTVISREGLTAAVGVKNLLIIRSGDVVLVCDKGSTASVSAITSALKERGSDKYL